MGQLVRDAHERDVAAIRRPLRFDVVEPDLHRRLERVVALEARELDDLLDEPGEPVALGEHPATEPLDGHRVVGGGAHRHQGGLGRGDGGPAGRGGRQGSDVHLERPTHLDEIHQPPGVTTHGR